MKHEFVVRKEIKIKAKPAEVWKALTTPELTRKYFFGCAVRSDWKEGHPISFKRKFLWMKIELKGTIQKIEPGQLLQYTLSNSGSDDPANQSLVTDKLSYHDGMTTLSITDDVGAAEGAEKRYKRSVKGWDKVLKGLKEVAEKE